jgi:uncharacterized protein YdeI (YjbR/CyaY-like superfamily)
MLKPKISFNKRLFKTTNLFRTSSTNNDCRARLISNTLSRLINSLKVSVENQLVHFIVKITVMKKTAVKEERSLKRSINPMPKGIRSLLVKHGVLEHYKERPPYQQNDYLGWIARAKLDMTKEKRINQMLDELKEGNKYMNMKWSPK